MKEFKIEVTVPESKLGVLLETLFIYGFAWKRTDTVTLVGAPLNEQTVEDLTDDFTPGSTSTSPLAGKTFEDAIAGMTEFPHGTRFDAPGVRVMMKRASLTGVETASLIGVDQSTVSGWICGRAVPAIGHAREFAELLGVPVEQIVRIYAD